MNPRAPIVLLSLLCVTLARGQDAPLSEKTRDHLSADIRFDPDVDRGEKEIPFELHGEIVELPALTVTESMRRRDLEHAIERSRREAEDRKYSVIRGGTLYTKEFKHSKLELGTWATGGGIGFLKLSW